MEKIIGITGHRTLKHDYGVLSYYMKTCLRYYKCEYVIVGMALGFDQLVVETCLESNIKYIAAVPFIGQERLWPKNIQDKYKEYLDKAFKVKITSDGDYQPWKLQHRNKWIVNNCDMLFAYLDPGNKKSGTLNCCNYATKNNKKVFNVYQELEVLLSSK